MSSRSIVDAIRYMLSDESIKKQQARALRAEEYNQGLEDLAMRLPYDGVCSSEEERQEFITRMWSIAGYLKGFLTISEAEEVAGNKDE
jgi:hypothetical protein